MEINTNPIEAYRQAGGQPAKKNQVGSRDKFDLQKAQETEKIILTGQTTGETGAIHVGGSSSILSNILTADENEALTISFARFGDSVESTQIYGRNARTQGSGITGQKVDLTG
ncbi:MAG: hypothetical protein ABIE07_05540 [Candidatus Zixiibacteriota bacterium]